jgi:3-deoxy-manno-octulosonate cytidylyltransferase (CMP-KDO synthetase)
LEENPMGRELFLVVLPARYGSTRFPGKPLVKISGRPLIEWVYRRAQQIGGAGELLVATDDGRIAEAVESFGGNVTMTSGNHATGTDRVAEIAATKPYDIVVNLQGDEPVFDPALVEEMADRLSADPGIDIVTACHAIDSHEEFRNPNVVKVVAGKNGRVLYFSRSPVPHGVFEGARPGQAYRHVGVYAFRKDALLRFARLDRTPLEQSESLEQLRALENGMNMAVVTTDSHTVGVDVPDDVKKVEKELNRIYTGLNGSESL